METTIKALSEIAVGDRIVKFGYLPRYPERPIHVVVSAKHGPANTEYTFTDEGDDHEPWRASGMNHIECEVVAA